MTVTDVELDFQTWNDVCPGRIHLMNHQDIDEAVLSLGMSTVPALGITVSIPPTHLVRDDFNLAQPFRALRPHEQYLWLRNHYLPRVIIPYVQRGLGVVEFTKQGLVHLHMICWDPEVLKDPDLFDLRAIINRTVSVKTITRSRNSKASAANFIHFLNDTPDWIEYLKKSQDKVSGRKHLYPFFWNDWDSIERPLSEVSNLFEEQPSALPPPKKVPPLVHARIALPTVAF